MKMRSMIALFALATFAIGPAHAQDDSPATKPVLRIAYYKIKPGKTEAFWKDVRENGVPLFQLAIDEGIMTDYMFVENAYKSNPDEWDVMLILKHENFAALDTLDARAGALYLEHYGEEGLKNVAADRAEFREVLALRLAREVPVR